VILSFACTALLCAALGLTWYGPAKDKPRLELRQANGVIACGEVVSLANGQLMVKTDQGPLPVDLTKATGIAPVDSCAPAVK